MKGKRAEYLAPRVKQARAEAGSRGGKKAADELTAAQRKARARKAARARWEGKS